MAQAMWRKWHRWVGAVTAPFLVFVAVTGMMLAGTELGGEEEGKRERLRATVSPVTLPADPAAWADPLSKALATAARENPGTPVDKVMIEFKGEPPTVVVYTGRPDGGEGHKLVCDAATGQLLRTESYTDKSLLHRLHSFEAVGDWGLGLSILWGFALAGLTVSGLVIYGLMRKPGRRFFW